jgi:nicotinamide-nucleotide amidase
MDNSSIEIITTGNELLSGITIDKNFNWLCESLFSLGAQVRFHQCISDNLDDLVKALNIAQKRSKFILFTGGLGPTDDDLTRESASQFFSRKLVLNKKIEKEIKLIFKKRNRPYSLINKKQAMFPEGAEIIQNPKGTAPGFCIKDKGSFFYFFPGVPSELRAMVQKSAFQKIKNLLVKEKNFFTSETLKVFGITESELAEKIKKIKSKNTFIGYRPHKFEIHLRIISTGKSKKISKNECLKIKLRLIKVLQKYVFTDKDVTLQEVIVNLLKKKKYTISFAESCTGGLISNLITNVPGSSSVFGLSFITYSNKSKNLVLKVSNKKLMEHGAVSKEVVSEMARGLNRISESNISVAVSGIAGPSGGSADKPVGTVYVSYLINKKISVKRYSFLGDRESIKLRTALEVLNHIRKNIL